MTIFYFGIHKFFFEQFCCVSSYVALALFDINAITQEEVTKLI